MYEVKFLILKLLKVLYKDVLIKLNYRVRLFFCSIFFLFERINREIKSLKFIFF